jgi:uncharacterized surface protein with fasciclin (FAS1) repeats
MKYQLVFVTLTLILGPLAVMAVSEAEADPEADAEAVNSLLTEQALNAPHPLHPLANPHPFLPLSINGIAAATAAAGHPFGPLFSAPPPAPTLKAKVPLGSCTNVCSILDLLVFNPDFSILVSVLKASGLVELLSEPGPITLFAPSNAAFDALPPPNFEALLADRIALQSILLRHATKGVLHSADFPLGPTPLITGAGERVTVTAFPHHVSLSSPFGVATIIDADNDASNGVVHVVDGLF